MPMTDRPTGLRRIAYAAVMALGGGIAVLHIAAIVGAIGVARGSCGTGEVSAVCDEARRAIPYFGVVILLGLGMVWVGARGIWGRKT